MPMVQNVSYWFNGSICQKKLLLSEDITMLVESGFQQPSVYRFRNSAQS